MTRAAGGIGLRFAGLPDKMQFVMEGSGKALYVFHGLLIACAILYCAGFVVYQLLRADANPSLTIFFAVAGVCLVVYLRSFLRFGPKGKASKGAEDS